MTNLNDLLTTSTSNFKAPPRFPEGLYEVIITAYELLPFHWKKSATSGLSYVPTIRPIRSIEADDEDNPEVAEEQRAKLEEYGDWARKEFNFAYTDNNQSPPQRVATIAEINFPLIETDESGEPVGIMEKHAWRFHRIENGVEEGFVHDVLGLSYPDGEALETIMEDTVNRKFIVQFEYETRYNDPTKSDLRVVNTMASV